MKVQRTHPLSRLLPYNEYPESPPTEPKKMYGMGTCHHEEHYQSYFHGVGIFKRLPIFQTEQICALSLNAGEITEDRLTYEDVHDASQHRPPVLP
jgi:hypothetical protein